MRLLKIVSVLFIIYFIRRFFQMYNALKQMNEDKELFLKNKGGNGHTTNKTDTIDADFKVVD